MKGVENVNIIQGALEDLQPDHRDLDVIICHNVFPHFDDKKLAVAKIGCMLKRGGRLIVSHFMNSGEVNNLHRKTHPAVVNDFLPGEEEMRKILESEGITVQYIIDDESGYLLKSSKR